MIKKKLRTVIPAAFIRTAFGLLITAMIVHAVRGEKSTLAGLFGIGAAAVSFIGFVIILVIGKGKGEKNENKER